MSAPDLAPEDIALVDEVLRSRSLSCGPMVDRFEAEWCRRFGARHAVAVSSGTAGLHLALIVAGAGPGDLVLTSPFSFVASANAALYEHATPIFVDIDPLTFNMDPSTTTEALDDLARAGTAARRWLPPSLRSGTVGRAKAVLPIHVFGQPAAMTPILAAASRHGIHVVEDACEAVGAEYDGRPAGTFGTTAVFGFYPNKQMTTGEGGIVVTNDDGHARVLRSLRNQGRDEDATWLHHVRLGYNYRLDDMSAALGLGQLHRIDTLLAKRARVAATYSARLAGEDRLTLPSIAPTTTRMSWFVYVVRLAADIDRDAIVATLAAEGIPSRPYFPPVHLQPLYRTRFGYREGDFPIAEAVGRSTLALPFHGNLSDDHIDEVCTRLVAAIGRSRGASARPARLSGASA